MPSAWKPDLEVAVASIECSSAMVGEEVSAMAAVGVEQVQTGAQERSVHWNRMTREIQIRYDWVTVVGITYLSFEEVEAGARLNCFERAKVEQAGWLQYLEHD